MRVLEMFHRTLILTILLILTTPLSWAASWPIEERAAMCDVGIIETMDRLNGQPHDRDECIRDPDAYLTKIMNENKVVSDRLVKEKQAAQLAPINISIDAMENCGRAIAIIVLTDPEFLPYTADSSSPNIKKWRAPEGITVVKGDISFTNLFGQVIPHIFTCEFMGDKVLNAEVFPR
ncbi:MAG: hypothetical protein IH999_06610 [Proteobacteria bacterium]|nr:hypothetical protein [Pseudomonadota bacterium]